MPQLLNSIYRFLPIQLVLLHFRKYQLLLLFWIILVTAITGDLAANFGASSLFLAPEYLGSISFRSMLLLGAAMASFVMAWNITTFIIHSHRIPFLGATRQAFLNYCINNSGIPLAFLLFYSIMAVRYQWYQEHTSIGRIAALQAGFYLGFIIILMLSFFYFFRAGRDMLKVILSKITNPSRIREIIPYDSLDVEFDIIRAETYLGETLKIERFSELEQYHPRVMSTVLRRHHRNATAATIFALLFLILLGIFRENPILRIPAGSGFLILFAVMMGMVGAVKYFLKTWELMGWVILLLFFSILTSRRLFDLRSTAYGMSYSLPKDSLPVYDYANLKKVFTPARYNRDAEREKQRLHRWKAVALPISSKPPLIIISVSGGGTRSAYWTFRTLQYLDSLSGGGVYRNTVMLTGASGGMIGAAYWRAIHRATQTGKIKQPYNPAFQERIGRDLLNSIIFSFVSVDLVAPFNKVKYGTESYTRDRGYAMERELIENTWGALGGTIGDYQQAEATAQTPQMIISGTIVNDGRRLLIGAQPLAYLTQPAYSLTDTFQPPIDAVDFATFFATQQPYNLRFSTALRMNATFPYILPVVKLPSNPEMNVMDAGLRDNFGMEVASRYLFVMRDWIQANTGNVIFLQIRDTKEHEVFLPSEQKSLSEMLMQPLTVIERKWEPFQSYTQSYIREMASLGIPNLHHVTMTYIPEEQEKMAALNFHLTQREKNDLYGAVHHPQNKAATQQFLSLIKP